MPFGAARENPLNILDTLEQLKNLGIIEERFEQQSPYFVFCNNSTRKMIYERMSPSRRCYYHRILAEHLKHYPHIGQIQRGGLQSRPDSQQKSDIREALKLLGQFQQQQGDLQMDGQVMFTHS